MATQRLPIPGRDDGTWGDILNGFLGVAHNADGTLIAAAITAAGGYVKPSSGIPGSDLDTATQTTLATVASKYTKPAGGIPATDLAGVIPESLLDSTLQTKIDTASTKAGTAVQSVNGKTPTSGNVTINVADINDVQGGSGATNNQVLVFNGTTSKWAPGTVSSTTVSDATTGAKGIVQLAGDLAGTAAAPTLVATSNVNSIIANNTTVTGKLNSSTAATTYAPLASPTFTGTVTVPTPTNATDASTKAYVDAQITGGATADATTTSKGKVQLAGDLAGTAAAPTVAKINGTAVPATPTAGQVLTATSGTAAAWTTPASGFADPTTTKGDLIIRGSSSTTRQAIGTDGQVLTADSTQATGAKWATPATAPVTSVAGKTGTVTLVEADVANLTSDLAAKAPLASPTFTGTVTVPTPVNTTDAATKTYVDTQVSSGTADATTTTKGKVQLAGDLAGTAATPAVAKINGVTLPGSAPAAGNVLTATSATATAWTTPAAGVTLDTTASDIQPLGTQAAGSTGKAADASHVHQMPRLDQVSAPTAAVALNAQKITGLANGTAATDAAAFGQIPNVGTTAVGGDLSGTVTNATVAKVQGIAVSGTAPSASGQVLTSTSTTAAAWATPSVGAQALTPTAVKTGAYTASAGDLVPVDATSAAITVTLPTAPADKSRVTVKKIDTSANLVTLTTGGSDVYNKTGGVTSLLLQLPGQAIALQYSSSSSIWYVVGDDIPLTSLVTGLSKSVTSAYTLANTDHVILADATSAAFTVTLPTAVSYNGRFTIDAITTGTNMVTVATTSSQTIDGSATTTLGTQTSGATFGSVDLISDGANWRTV